MRLTLYLLSVLLLGSPAFGQELMSADLLKEGYRLPLTGPYAVLRDYEAFLQTPGHHRYGLVAITGESSSSSVLAGIQEVAVSGSHIVGTTDKAYFLLDAQALDAKPVIYSSLEEWQAALAAAGLPHDIQLGNPDTMAIGLPRHALQPWEYRMMRGFLGCTDDVWSLIIQLAGLAIAFLIGLLRRSTRSPFYGAVVLGLLVNVLAQVLIAGEGSGACVGFFVLPVYCYLAMLIGKGVRRLVARVRPPVTTATMKQP